MGSGPARLLPAVGQIGRVSRFLAALLAALLARLLAGLLPVLALPLARWSGRQAEAWACRCGADGCGADVSDVGAEQMSATWVRSRCQRVACNVWGGFGTQPGRSQGDINCLTSLPCTARVTTNADADQEQGAARCSGADDNCGLLGAHAGHLVATARCWRGWRGCLEVNGGKHRQL